MSSASVQNVALVGTGMVARTHLLSISDLSERINLSGILSRNSDNAVAFAKEAEQACGYPVGTYDDIDAVCADSDVDFVILLTPPNARLEFVEKVAAAGKSILMEKPIERTLDAATRIVEICERNKVKLGIVFQHRVRASSMKLAELIAGGSFGKLHIAEAIIPWWREQSYYDEPGRGTYERDGGGVLISQAIHTLDLLLSLTGPVQRVQAMAHTTQLHNMESEDYVTAGLRFQNGAVGTVVASTASFPGGAESITMHFDHAVARLQSGELHIHWRDGRVEDFGATATTGGGADPMAFTHEWHRDVIQNFCESLADDTPLAASGRSALEVQALIDALNTSSSEGKTVALA